MAKIFDRVKFNVPSTPGTGDVTIGTRYDNSFFLPDEQGAVDGDEVYYVIQKSNKDMEVGIGTIASSATVIQRTTVLSSIIAGTDGTTKINIDGSAFMALVTPAYALKSMRNVRTVTGTTDTITDGDGGSVVSYNSASAVAVSIAQAGAAGAFLKGWFTFVRNINAGAVTYTPTTSTVNGVATLVLASGDSAMIVSDGTNYQAVVWRGIDTDGTLAANSDTRIPSQKAVKTYVDSATTLFPMGQGQLAYVSSTSIQLNRFGGSYLFIDGANRQIPSTGPTLANTGLTAATVYYIYAYMNSGTMTLESSTTVPVIDSTYGHPIKTGDATRSFVGPVYTDAGTPGTFADSLTKRWVRSWYNRNVIRMYAGGGSGSFTNTSITEWAAGPTVQFVKMPLITEYVSVCGISSGYTSGGDATGRLALYMNGSLISDQLTASPQTTKIATWSAQSAIAAATGQNYLRLGVQIDANTLNLSASSIRAEVC